MPTPTVILKFIYGINEPKFVQTSQVEGHGPQLDSTHSRPTGYKSGVLLRNLLGFSNSLDCLIELRKTQYLRLQFCYKGYNSRIANENTYRVRSWGTPEAEWNQGMSPSWHINMFTNW